MPGFSMESYAMGYEAGKGVISLAGADLTFTDDGEGNITITAADEEE